MKLKLMSLAWFWMVANLVLLNSGCTFQGTGERSAGPAITGADQVNHKEKDIVPDPSLPPLPIEKQGIVETLPEDYPDSWVLVNELSFSSMFGGRVIIIDAAEPRHAKRIKGMVDKSLIGNFTQSRTRNELYIIETFHERGSRGKRTDVLSIYNKSTLKIEKEIIWPQPNRIMALPERYSMSLSADEKFMYVSNFSPAASFTVVDLDKREIVTEISTPGCVLTYPVGRRGVASICSNGALMNTVVNDDGSVASRQMLEPFFDTVKTPVFEHPIYVGSKMYFPSFHGLLHVFDVSTDVIKYEGRWDMLNPEDKAGNWRPSGLVLNDVDESGLMYTIFQPDGHEGSQTHGGPQVWVFDLKARKRVRVIDVPNWAISIGVTGGESPLLVAANGEMNLDVFNAHTGEFIQTLSDFGNVTPLDIVKAY